MKLYRIFPIFAPRISTTMNKAMKKFLLTAVAAIYDMNGRQLNEKPNNGVYIQSGQKFVSK